MSPLNDPPQTLPGRLRIVRTGQALPSLRFTGYSAKAVPTAKPLILEWLSCSGGGLRGGNKVLLTMLARQFFPSGGAKERFH
jgi:hypothetical protein